MAGQFLNLTLNFEHDRLPTLIKEYEHALAKTGQPNKLFRSCDQNPSKSPEFWNKNSGLFYFYLGKLAWHRPTTAEYGSIPVQIFD